MAFFNISLEDIVTLKISYFCNMKNYLVLFLLVVSSVVFSQKLPKGFVYLETIDESIQKEMRYFSSNNFIGKKIDGYKNDTIIISKEAAEQLERVQIDLKMNHLSLKIFDAYRPQQAVNHFVKWAKVLNDTIMKKDFYPGVKKSELFAKGYIASKSGHTRGSTVDLTVINKISGIELDMGSPYDFFGIESHPYHKNIKEKQHKNRMLLRNIMIKYGFKPYENEWWHFTLKDEPFPTTYFNFPIK